MLEAYQPHRELCLFNTYPYHTTLQRGECLRGRNKRDTERLDGQGDWRRWNESRLGSGKGENGKQCK